MVKDGIIPAPASRLPGIGANLFNVDADFDDLAAILENAGVDPQVYRPPQIKTSATQKARLANQTQEHKERGEHPGLANQMFNSATIALNPPWLCMCSLLAYISPNCISCCSYSTKQLTR